METWDDGRFDELTREHVWVSDRLHAHIRAAMRDRTQSDVARAAGLSRQYVHNVLARTESAREREHLERLLDVLGLELDAYVTDPSERPQPWTLPSRFDKIPNTDRAEVERILAWMLRIHDRPPDP